MGTSCKNNNPLFILYGSATGNAEHIAKDLASKVRTQIEATAATAVVPFDSVICAPLDQFKKHASHWEQEPDTTTKNIQKHALLIITSTTGNGDAPENASRFVRFLKRQKVDSSPIYRHVAFAVLGLGDTNYDHYCQCAKEVDRKIHELGGTRACPLQCADEATGLEDAVEPWTASILDKIVGAVVATKTTVSDASTTVNNNDTAADAIAKDETTNGDHKVTPKTAAAAAAGKIDSHDEEKKVDGVDDVTTTTTATAAAPTTAAANSIVTTTTTTTTNGSQTTSPGVAMMYALLKLDPNLPLPTVDPCQLPGLTACLSSCQLIRPSISKDENDNDINNANDGEEMQEGVDDMDQQQLRRNRSNSVADSHSTASTGFFYNLHRPYESTIQAARYLTSTTTSNAAAAVTRAAQALRQEQDSLQHSSNLQAAFDSYDEAFPLQAFPNNGSDPNNAMAVVERNSKRVIELTLSLPDDYTLEYAPGDSLGLQVPNAPAAVDFILRMLQEKHGIAPTQLVTIQPPQSADSSSSNNAATTHDSHAPTWTVEEVVRTRIDLSQLPVRNKRTLNSLALQYATDPAEAAALQLLASKTPLGEQLFSKWIDEQRVSVVDLLQAFPSTLTKLDLAGLLSILPAIPPRYYSVSSSPLDSNHASGNSHGQQHEEDANESGSNDKNAKKAPSLTIAFSVVDYLTPSLKLEDGTEIGCRRIRGLATRYMEVLASPFLSGFLSSLPAATTSLPTLKIFPKPTADFRMPASLATPLILIGPGTGIAPFMGFLSHRRALLSHTPASESAAVAQTVVEGTWRGGYELEENEISVHKSDASGLKLGVDFRRLQLQQQQQQSPRDGMTRPVGSVDVFFGCRHKDHDWLYREEMLQFEREGIITKLYTAFSRDGNQQDSPHYKYVQDIMLKDPDCAARLVELVLEQNASIYICGDGNQMAKDVQAAWVKLISTKLGTGAGDSGNGLDEAQAMVDQLKANGRYVMDIWS